MREKVAQIAAELEKAGMWAEADEDGDYYLLRYGMPGDDRWLVLMHDLGLTWEPARAYPTPCYCKVDVSDPVAAADKMSRVLKAFLEGGLPRNDREGEGAGETV